MVELNKENFKDEIKDGIVVVDFWSPTCPPCMALKPMIESREHEYSNVKFCSVDASKNKSVCIKNRVMALPAILFFKDSVEIKRFVKNISIEDIDDKLAELSK